jgi:hypothetical protein
MLSELEVRKTKPGGKSRKLPDGKGMHLLVTPCESPL